MSMLDQSSRFVRLLGLSGSIRSASYSVAILRALQAALGPGIKLEMADIRLPLYNEDEDGENTGAVVQAFRQAIAQVDGLVISTPEYNHGIPGVLKNALDWVVGSGELVEKPVALFNASPRSTYAQASLLETLTVMSANIVEEAFITIELAGKKLDEAGMVADSEISKALKSALAVLETAIGMR